MSVEFTQYLMPDGEKKRVWIELSAGTELKARQITEVGLRFEIEMLSDYKTISMTIVGLDPEIGEEQDLAQKLCPNGPEVPLKVTDLIMGFDLEEYKRKLGDHQIPS